MREHTGRTVHRVPDRDGLLVETGHLAVRLELEPKDGGFFLYRLDAGGACVADTWHESIAEAKAQASFEYEVREDDWSEIEHR